MYNGHKMEVVEVAVVSLSTYLGSVGFNCHFLCHVQLASFTQKFSSTKIFYAQKC